MSRKRKKFPSKYPYYGHGGYYGKFEAFDFSDWGSWKTPGKAASSFWTSSVYSGSDDSIDQEWKYKEILYNVANAANVPANSIGSGERIILVRWASNKKDDLNHRHGLRDNTNHVASDTIVLSPDVIDKDTTRKQDWSQEERQDVLIADAMTLAAMKATASAKSEAAVSHRNLDEKVSDVAQKLWTCQETMVAEQAVLSAYPGFKPYYASYRDYWTDEDARNEIESQIRVAESRGRAWADGAVAAARYEMLYPDKPLDLPRKYRKAVDAAKKSMPMDAPAEARGNNAVNAAKKMLRILTQKEQEKGEGEGEGEDEDKKDKKPFTGIVPMYGLGREKLDDGEKNSFLIPKRIDGEMSSYDKDGVRLGDTIDQAVMNEDSWREGTRHIMVRPAASSDYQFLVGNLKHVIRGVKNRLKLRAEKLDLMMHGLRRGNIDDGSLYKLSFNDQEPLIFEQQEILNKVNLSFGILIDESGSMAYDGVCGRARIDIARDVAIVLAESMRDIDGVNLAIMGHTGQGNCQDGECREMALHHYYTPENPFIESLSRVQYFSENLDGYAMLEFSRKMLAWYPNSTRTILVVSDGVPSAHGYSGPVARAHVSRVCRAARRAGVEIFGIGIDNAYGEVQGEEMYGKDNFVVLKDAESSMALLCSFIVDAVRKTCVLE